MFQKVPPPSDRSPDERPPLDQSRGVVVPLYPEAEQIEQAEPDGLVTRFAGFIGAGTLAALGFVAELLHSTFVGHGSLRRDPAPARPRGARALVMRHVHVAGVRALPLVCVVAFATGAAIVLQTKMAPTPPSGEFGRMLVVLMVRELAPLLTAIIMSGHSATMMAAELGPMQLALASSDNAGPRLWPRIAGSSIASLTLAVHFAAVAIVGAFLVSQMMTLRTFDAVKAGLQHELAWFDLPVFLLKTLGLGAIVGWFGCHFALNARSSPVEVARGASRAFVSSMMVGAIFSIGITVVLYAIIGAPPPP